MLPSSLVRTITLRRSSGAEYTTGIDGDSNEARRRATCASIRRQRIVSATRPIMVARVQSLTHRRGPRGLGATVFERGGGFDLAFDLVRRGAFEGAFEEAFLAFLFLAFLTGMMRGNDYSRQGPEQGRCVSVRGARNDQ